MPETLSIARAGGEPEPVELEITPSLAEEAPAEATQDNVARGLLRALRREGVEHAFLVPGGSIDLFLPEYRRVGVAPVVAAHEAGAAYMADGYGRARGSFGVCMGIAGPGVTNMMTPLASAHADRASLLLLTGSLPYAWRGRGAFQDATLSGLSDLEVVRPVTVYAQEVPAAALAGNFLRNALRAMAGVRPGPAFLAVPEEFQSQPVELPARALTRREPPRVLDREAMTDVRALLQGATRVAIYAGNGCVRSGAGDALRRFAEEHAVPVVTTLRAKGVYPEDEAMALGVFGMGGSLHARALFRDGGIDVLVVAGVSLNEYNTLWSRSLQSRRKIVHVDIDPAALDPNDYDALPVQGDAKTAIEWLANDDATVQALRSTRARREAWIARLQTGSRFDHAAMRTSDRSPLHPARVMADLRAIAPRDTNVLPDSGAHTFFAGHHWESYAPGQWFVTTTMGPMGWAIAAAVGVKLARPEQPCLVITGDGCMLMHGMEIRTAVRQRLPIVYVVINNAVLASVYLRAKKIDSAGVPTTELGTISWADFARNLGADGAVVTEAAELRPAFARAFASGRPYVVDVRCDPDAATPNTSSPV